MSFNIPSFTVPSVASAVTSGREFATKSADYITYGPAKKFVDAAIEFNYDNASKFATAYDNAVSSWTEKFKSFAK